MTILVNVLIVLATAAAMEAIAWFLHKHVMHGVAWHWHESHHEDRPHGIEWNDLFVLLPALISIGLYVRDDWAFGPLFAVASGLVLYGVLYVLVHEGLAHGRLPLVWRSRHPYVRRLVQAHRLHHAVKGRDGGVSFGFLYAPPVPRLARTLKERRRSGPTASTTAPGPRRARSD